MNKHIIHLLLGEILAACQSSPTYTITGEIANYEGRILLLAPQATDHWDTLGNILSANGSFTFIGESIQPIFAEIVPANSKFRIPIFLQKGDFKVEADLQKPQEYIVTGGGKLQQLHHHFHIEELKIKAFRDSMRTIYEKQYDMQDRFGQLQVSTLLSHLDTLYDQAENRFIRQHDNLVSASLLYKRMRLLFERKCLHKKYALLGKKAKETIPGKMLQPLVEKEKRIIVGGIAPDFQMETPEGKNISLYDIKAKVKIIDFWASWCAPCRAANPHLRQIYQKYKDKGLEIIGVSFDTQRESWKKAIQEDQVEWIQMSDLKGWNSIASELYDIHGIPCIYILDEQNQILGARVWGEEIDKHLAKIFE